MSVLDKQGHYGQCLANWNDYYDIFNHPNKTKLNILTAFVWLPGILLAVADAVLDIILIIYLYNYSKIGFFITYLSVLIILCHPLQMYYFLLTDRNGNSPTKWYKMQLFWLSQLSLLPFLRVYRHHQLYIMSMTKSAEVDEEAYLLPHEDSFFGTDYINCNSVSSKWLPRIYNYLEMFFFRGLTQCSLTFITLFILILIDLNLIENDVEKEGLFAYGTVIVSGCLFIKLVNFLLASGMESLSGSQGYEVYTHVCDCLTWMCDICRHTVTLIIVFYSICLYFFHHQRSNREEDYYILLQIYFYPSVYILLYMTCLLDFRGFVCASQTNIGAFVYIILAPVVFCLSLVMVQLAIMFVGDAIYLTLVSGTLLQPTLFHDQMRIDPLDNVFKDGNYKAFYDLMNKVSYFLYV